MVSPNELMCYNKEDQHVDIPKPPRSKDSKFTSIEFKGKKKKTQKERKPSLLFTATTSSSRSSDANAELFPLDFRSEQPENRSTDFSEGAGGARTGICVCE